VDFINNYFISFFRGFNTGVLDEEELPRSDVRILMGTDGEDNTIANTRLAIMQYFYGTSNRRHTEMSLCLFTGNNGINVLQFQYNTGNV